MTNLYIFDSSTLVRLRARGRTYDQEPIPTVQARIQELAAAGYTMAVIQCAGGVATGHITLQEAIEALQQTIAHAAMGQGASLHICPHYPPGQQKTKHPGNPEYLAICDCRKPAPGLLLAAMREHHADPQNTVFVGDEELDATTAANAQIRYIPADEFFSAEEPPPAAITAIITQRYKKPPLPAISITTGGQTHTFTVSLRALDATIEQLAATRDQIALQTADWVCLQAGAGNSLHLSKGHGEYEALCGQEAGPYQQWATITPLRPQQHPASIANICQKCLKTYERQQRKRQ